MTHSDSEEHMNWLSSNHQVYRSKTGRRTSSNTTMDFQSDASLPRSGCCSCNAQICLSYFLSVFSSLIIVHGLWLWYMTNVRIWLILPATGVGLIFIGACLYSSGHSNLARAHRSHALGRGRTEVQSKNRRFSRRGAQRQSFFESSNLSLNMLPQCFNQHSNNHRYLMLGTMSSSHDVTQQSASPKSRVVETNIDPPCTSTSTPYQESVIAHTIPIEPESVSESSRLSTATNSTDSTRRPDRPPPTYEQIFLSDPANFQTL